MATHDIPPDLRRFILTSIPSVPHIEALMLLRAAAPSQWSAADLARRLYIPAQSAATVLVDLCKSGILHCDEANDTFCYQPGLVVPAELIDRLAALYTSQLVEVTMLIHSKLDRKAQQFADAFNLRKGS